MVLDPEEHARAARARLTPDGDRVGDVAEVEDFLAALSGRLPLAEGKGDPKAAKQIDDTVAFLKVPVNNVRVAQGDDGRFNMLVTVNPLPVADDWSLMADGSVAVLRARDYHVDWIRANGTKEATAKTPFDWKRMSEDEKAAFLDSTKVSL